MKWNYHFCVTKEQDILLYTLMLNVYKPWNLFLELHKDF